MNMRRKNCIINVLLLITEVKACTQYLCHIKCILHSSVHGKLAPMCLMNSSTSAHSGGSQLLRSVYMSEPGCTEESLALYRGGRRSQEASFDTSHLCIVSVSPPLCWPLRQRYIRARLERTAQKADCWQLTICVFTSGGFREVPGMAMAPSRPHLC